MKFRLFIAISLLAVSLSDGAAARSLESCAGIENPAERLACYDTLAGRLPANPTETSGKTPVAVKPAAPKADIAETPKASVRAPGEVEPVAPKAKAIVPAPSSPVATPAAPAPAVTSTSPAVGPTPHAETVFGLEHKEDRPEEFQFKWARKEKDAYGKWIISLENGQVWHQTDSARFSFRNPEKQVVISRGFMGSFYLEEPGRNRKIRVKRVK